ncbi:MAG: helix-turn-helix domain-containing protein [Saprospiraceae bacterium]|jgi:transposase|nr:helix-turn-helix domain-containing protein [Saprospiraceae bacterium]
MGRKKRYIVLTPEETQSLEHGYKTGASHVFRARCHCILLSGQGKTIYELCAIFGVLPNTVIAWFNRWKEGGLKGLETKPGQGRKPKIKLENMELVEQVKSKVKASPKQLDKVLAELQSDSNLIMSRATLKRFLKKIVGDGSDFDAI